MADDKGRDKPSLRGRAEKLVGGESASIEGLSAHELASLFHELQVHQIELKMQNEELRSAQEELERSRKKYFELYDLAPVGYLSLDRTGLILEANLKAGSLLGQPRSHLLRRSFREFVVSSYWIALAEHLRAVGEEGQWRRCELELLKRDGSILIVHLETIRVDEGEEDDAFELRSALIDITERKRAEQERERLFALLQERNAEMDAVFAAMQDAVVIYDMDMDVRRVNPMFIPTYGFDPIGLNVREIIERTQCRWLDGRPFCLEEQPTPRALRGETVLNQRFLITRPGGAERALENSSAPLHVGDRVLGAVTVWHDITDRKKADEALRASEEQYRRLVELSPEAIYVNRDNRIELINSAALRLFGATSPEQILGKSPFDLFHPDFHPIVRERIQKLLEGRAVPLIEEKIVRLDGTVRDVEVATSFFDDQNGRAIQVMARDITERKRAEERIRTSEKSAKAQAAHLQAVLDAAPAMIWIAHDRECR
jgi:PAS domain S-box-containing protein